MPWQGKKRTSYVYVVYICRAKPDPDQNNPLTHIAPPILGQFCYYTTLLYQIIPVLLKSLLVYGLSKPCGQGEDSHMLSGKKSKMVKPDSGYLQRNAHRIKPSPPGRHLWSSPAAKPAEIRPKMSRGHGGRVASDTCLLP